MIRDWLRRRKPEPPKPLPPEQWQAAWHDILDEPPAVESPCPDPLPKDLDADYRLHFGFWQAGEDRQRRMLACLPYGSVLAERCQQHASLPPLDLGFEEARQIMRQWLDLVRPLCDEFPEPDAEIRQVYGDDGLKVLNETDNPAYTLTDRFGSLVNSATGSEGLQAYAFLHETFYRAKSSYHTQRWLFWPLVESAALPPFCDAPEVLERAGYRFGWHGDGSVVMHRDR